MKIFLQFWTSGDCSWNEQIRDGVIVLAKEWDPLVNFVLPSHLLNVCSAQPFSKGIWETPFSVI